MIRSEYERSEAAMRGKTVDDLRREGFFSARCQCGADDCVGWQSVAVPPESSIEVRFEILSEFRGLSPQRFGGS
jgi:hypothetical protein